VNPVVTICDTQSIWSTGVTIALMPPSPFAAEPGCAATRTTDAVVAPVAVVTAVCTENACPPMMIPVPAGIVYPPTGAADVNVHVDVTDADAA